jgi:hypothetical protein
MLPMIRFFAAAVAALCMFTLAAFGEEYSNQPVGTIVLAYADIDITSSPRPSFDPAPVAAKPLPLSVGMDIPDGNIRPKPRPADLYQQQRLAELPHTLKGATDFMCLAVTIYHEARGEIREGQAAVASVILQRAAAPGRWGSTVCDVTVPVQFSYLNEDMSFAPITDYDSWMSAVEVATVAMVEGPDPWLEGADHYHTKDSNPYWNKHMPVVATIGNHIFYADPMSRRVSG